MVAQLVERSPRLQCRGFESHLGQLFIFPWKKRAVLGVVDFVYCAFAFLPRVSEALTFALFNLSALL